jgi:cbb3-type cytochrome oxidase subunit 3
MSTPMFWEITAAIVLTVFTGMFVLPVLSAYRKQR